MNNTKRDTAVTLETVRTLVGMKVGYPVTIVESTKPNTDENPGIYGYVDSRVPVSELYFARLDKADYDELTLICKDTDGNDVPDSKVPAILFIDGDLVDGKLKLGGALNGILCIAGEFITEDDAQFMWELEND